MNNHEVFQDYSGMISPDIAYKILQDLARIFFLGGLTVPLQSHRLCVLVFPSLKFLLLGLNV